MPQNLVIVIIISAAVLFLTVVALFFFDFKQVMIWSNHYLVLLYAL